MEQLGLDCYPFGQGSYFVASLVSGGWHLDGGALQRRGKCFRKVQHPHLVFLWPGCYQEPPMTNTDQGHLFQSSIFQEQNICTDPILVTSCTLHRLHVFYANLVVSALPLWSVALVFNTRGDDDILILFGCCSRPLVWRHLRQGKCKLQCRAL